MKILFIYKYEFVEPLGILSLSSYLKKEGHNVQFIDLYFCRDYLSEIKKIKPDVIAYSVTTGKHKFYLNLNNVLKKELKFFALFGGPHCTFFPEFIKEKGVNAICRGEGELAAAEFLKKLEKKEDLRFIQNIDIKIKGKIYKNSLRNKIPNLDILPFVDRELTAKYSNYQNAHVRYVLTGRGCPYNCTYCFNHSYNKLYADKGKILRQRSVDNIIKELILVKKQNNPRRFQFIDDTFILNKKWVLEFCKKYKKEIKLPFICYARINLIDEEIIKALKNAGCITLLFAIESGNEFIRNTILKRNISEAQTLSAAKLCRKYKINLFTQNIVGLPGETIENVWETIKLNIQCQPSYAWASIFQPYPGTELCNYSVKKGYYRGNVRLIGQDYFTKSVMKLKDINKIERLHHLFPIAVNYPFLIPGIKILIKLPLNKIYYFFWNIHRAYSYFFKVKLIDFSELFITK
jgi:radical SAM superfamily enzyme YgiQ (UPF0313 family)